MTTYASCGIAGHWSKIVSKTRASWRAPLVNSGGTLVYLWRQPTWILGGKGHPESVPKAVPLTHRGFSCASGVLIRPYHRPIEEQMWGHATAIALQVLAVESPGATALPASETVVYRVPVANLSRNIVPGYVGASDREDCFNERAVTQCRKTGALVFEGSEAEFNLSPSDVGEEQASRLPSFPP
jgi:hypothetical protein